MSGFTLTLLALALLAVAALAPLGLTLLSTARGRGRRDSALAIHRQQLRELERDLAEGRIGAAEHASAVLEVQRRLLAAAETPETEAHSGSRAPLLAALLLVPVLAALLYAVDGRPGLPAAPLEARRAEVAREAADAGQLIDRLRTKLATLDQNSDLARQGYVLLGNAEYGRGNLAAAAEAWRKAVAIRFDPELAAQTAEAQTQLDGKVSFDSAELFRRALAVAPPAAPWRQIAEQRLAEAAK